MKLKQTLGLLLCIAISSTLNAQVTIGSSKEPMPGALLDLKTETDGKSIKGLGMPRVKLTTLAAISDITGAAGQEAEHTGLIVYNTGKEERATDRVCPGLHVWDGTAWQPLTAYADPLEQDVFMATTRGFEFLDPASPTDWPADKEADRAAGNYALGNSKTSAVLDHETNSYNTSRFYVGYKTITSTYDVQRSYNCDPTATPVWVSESTREEIERTFSDGVWTTENLRATTLPHNGAAIAKHLSMSTTIPQYYIPGNLGTVTRAHGLLYNWIAAINMGDAAGQTPDPGNVEQGRGTGDDIRIRGLCPENWHVPAEQEWTDLENGIILKTSLFSTSANIGSPLLGYDDPATSSRGTHGTAMKATGSTINGYTSGGSSKTSAQGGFDVYLTGFSYNGLPNSYGQNTIFAAGSSFNTNMAWSRIMGTGVATVGSLPFIRHYLTSIRCMKD